MAFKFNPFSGQLDVVSPSRPPYDLIPSGVFVFVPENRQMLVQGFLQVDGFIEIRGRVVVVL